MVVRRGGKRKWYWSWSCPRAGRTAARQPAPSPLPGGAYRIVYNPYWLKGEVHEVFIDAVRAKRESVREARFTGYSCTPGAQEKKTVEKKAAHLKVLI